MEYKYSDEEIKENMLSRISTDVRKRAGTFINDALSPVAIELAEVYPYIEWIGRKLDVENLEDEELDVYVEDRTPLVRKKAIRASGYIRVEGKEGKIIAGGTGFTNGSYNYYSKSSVIIKNGRASILVECDEEGSKGNTIAKSITSLLVGDNEISSISNDEDIANGFDREDDGDFLQRYKDYVRATPTSGNMAHYKMWAESVNGVGIAKVIPLWDGVNTVKLIITNGEGQLATSTLVKNVQDYIDPGKKGLGSEVAPVGSVVTVVSAREKALNISVEIDAVNKLDYKKSIEYNINKYLKMINFTSDEISYAKLGVGILSVDGINDYKNLIVNGVKENIRLKEDEVAVLKNLEVV